MPGYRLFLVALLTLLFLPACSSSASPPTCSDPQTTTTVQLQDFSFGPNCFQASAGATLTLPNTGDAAHTFTVKGTGVDVKVDSGATGQASLDGIAPGTYTVVCTFHPEMVATMRVG